MEANDRAAGYKLIYSGALVNFDVIETKIDESPGGDESVVQIELLLGEEEDDGDRTEDHEWGGLGFILCLAVLSFADAQPRGMSRSDFQDDDEFGIADLVDCLRYERGELRFSADYLRGRCLKTDVTVRPDGTATLSTRCRGEAATRWIDRLKGKKMLSLVA